MKFRSTIKSIAIMLIACGVLLGGCQYTYVSVAAANTIEQEQTGTSSLTKSSDAKDEEQTGFDSDKSVNTSDDKNTKVAGNTKKVVPDPQKELDIRLSDLSRQVDEKAPGFTFWLALIDLVIALISIVAFLFVRNNYDKRLRGSNDKLVKIQNDLERLKGDFRALKQSFEEQRGYVDNLSRRAERDRQREWEHEIKYNAPVHNSDVPLQQNHESVSFASRSFEPKKDISVLLSEEHSRIINSYTELTQLWRSGDRGRFRRMRDEFKKQYNVQEFDCVNANERMNGGGAPVFMSHQGGKFWAIQSENVPQMFFVYPAPTLTYEVQVHSNGGMEEVFKSNYEYGKSYSGFNVDKPAYFTCTNNEWLLAKNAVAKGKLTLRA